MLRRVLSGLFAAALVLAGAALAPVRAERPGAGWVSGEQPALLQSARADQRLSRASDGRGAAPHQFLALLPASTAPARRDAKLLAAVGDAPVRLPVGAGSSHGARAPPA